MSSSEVLTKHSKELTRILALSTPSRQMLTTGLFAKHVIDDLEKMEIFQDSSSLSATNKLVGYIIGRIDGPLEATVWKELGDIECLKDLVEKMKKGIIMKLNSC